MTALAPRRSRRSGSSCSAMRQPYSGAFDKFWDCHCGRWLIVSGGLFEFLQRGRRRYLLCGPISRFPSNAGCPLYSASSGL